MRYVYFFGLEILGVILIFYSFWIVRVFGHNSWAEAKLGPGGSYTLWKMVGLGLIVLTPVLFKAGLFN